jgi:hypothetical protein
MGMRNVARGIVAGIVGWVAAVAAGDPGATRIAYGSDPGCAEARAAAAEVLSAIAAGDGAAARGVFRGDPAQAALLEAHLEFVAAGRGLHDAMAAKFGDGPAVREADPSAMYRGRAERLGQNLVLIGEADAFVASDFLGAPGVGRGGVGGWWGVTRLAESDHWAGEVARYLRAVAAVWRKVADDVAAGRVADVAAAQRAVREGSTAAGDTLRYAYAWDEPAPAGEPGVAVGDGAALVGLIGRPVGSAEVRGVIGTVPATSTLAAAREGLRVRAADAGVALNFGPDGVLRNVTFYAAGAEGCRGFARGLPFGLSVGDTRRDVERKVGRPAEAVGGGTVPYCARYPGVGIFVRYKGAGRRDPANAVHSVAFFAPGAGDRTPPAAVPPKSGDLTLRLVAGEGEGDAQEMTDQSSPGGAGTIRVRREAILDAGGIEEVLAMSGGAGGREPDQLVVGLTADGARRLGAAVAGDGGRRVAVVFEGRVVAAGTIRPGVRRQVLIELGPGWRDAGAGRGPATSDPRPEIDKVCDRMYALVTALPEGTEPSSP